MTLRLRKLAACTLTAGVIGAHGLPALGQTTPFDKPESRIARVYLRTFHNGAENEGSYWSTRLSPGETSAAKVWVGDTPCETAVGSAGIKTDNNLAPWMSAARQEWSVQIRLVTASIDRIAVELDWRHDIRDSSGELRRVAGEKRVIVLSEKEPYILGVAESAVDAGKPCAKGPEIIELTTELEDDERANAALQFDVWLQREDAKGARYSQQIQVTARAGDLVPINFDPLVWPMPGGACDYRLEIDVSLRGRLRGDGRVDLSVEPSRMPWNYRFPVMQTSESGRKVLAVSYGDPVQVVLPNESGLFPAQSCGDRATTAANGPTVDLAEVFKGQKMSLTITVRKGR